MLNMSRYQWVCTIIGLLLLSFGFLLYSLPSPSIKAQVDPQQQAYIPSVMLGTVSNVVTQSRQELSAGEWLTYESKSGGYSFMYPTAYTVTEYEQGFVQLHLVDEGPTNVILTLMYLQYEISPTEHLLNWAKLYDTYNKEGSFEVDFSPSNLDGSKFGPGSRQLYVESSKTSSLPLQAFLITNGSLVLRVSAHTPADSKSPPLQDIAQSVRFSDQAPKDLAQLFAPNPVPGFTTFQEYFEFIKEGDLVNQALDIRMFTGETPTKLLEQMSERGRHRYEVALKAQEDVVQELDRQRAKSTPTWSTYTSTKGGYSLRYPSNWTIAEGIKGTLVITDPNGQWADKITVIYLDFEKSEADTLAVWAEKFFALGLGPELGRTFSPVTLAVKDPTGTSQQVHMQYASPIPGEGYLVTHGRLVLQISTDSASASLAEQLQLVANSVAFAENGPTDQAQLSAPEKVPAYITIEAWQQREDDSKMAIEAVNHRLKTGEVDTDLLAKMSDNARKEYDRMFANAADYIAEMDKQRQAQAAPAPSITPYPGVNSPEFFEQERIYNEGLKMTATAEYKNPSASK